MSANDLVMQRLSDTLAQLHTEMVQVRQQRQRALAEAYESVTEYQFLNGASANQRCQPVPMMSGPIIIKRFFCYTSANNTKLVFNSDEGDNSFQVPIPSGITVFTCEVTYRTADRPYLLDTAGGASVNLYLRISGWQVPSQALVL